MTEYNLFCYAEDKNKDGFQQARRRVFNTIVTQEERREVQTKLPKIKLEFDPKLHYSERYKQAWSKAREQLSQEDKQKFLDIPYFNASIFEKITGIKVNETQKGTTLKTSSIE